MSKFWYFGKGKVYFAKVGLFKLPLGISYSEYSNGRRCWVVSFRGETTKFYVPVGESVVPTLKEAVNHYLGLVPDKEQTSIRHRIHKRRIPDELPIGISHYSGDTYRVRDPFDGTCDYIDGYENAVALRKEFEDDYNEFYAYDFNDLNRRLKKI